MTEHKQAAKMFSVLLVFFTVVILLFFYTAQKNIPHQKSSDAEKIAAAVRTPIAWSTLPALTDDSRVTVVVGGASVTAEVARSGAKQERGLSNRDPLANGEGMLFVFDQAKTLSFWNKDMRFPIDIIWMKNGVVTGAAEHLPSFPAGGVPTIVTSPEGTSVALEVPDGFVKQHAITNTSNIIMYENK